MLNGHSIREVKGSLQSQVIFKPLSETQLQTLCESALVKNFAVGDMLIKEGISNGFLYLIIEGRVKIKSYGIKVASVSAGNLIGEIAAAGLGSASADSATADVIAAEESKVFCFPMNTIRTLSQANENFAQALHDSAMSRLLG